MKCRVAPHSLGPRLLQCLCFASASIFLLCVRLSWILSSLSSREHGDCALAIPLLEKCIGVGETKAYPLLSDCLLRGGQAESKLTKASETEESNMEIPEPITENK